MGHAPSRRRALPRTTSQSTAAQRPGPLPPRPDDSESRPGSKSLPPASPTGLRRRSLSRRRRASKRRGPRSRISSLRAACAGCGRGGGTGDTIAQGAGDGQAGDSDWPGERRLSPRAVGRRRICRAGPGPASAAARAGSARAGHGGGGSGG
jgi:hypothetical protein